jgi:hypothetical protein
MSKYSVKYEVIDNEKSQIVSKSVTKNFKSKQEAESFVNKRNNELASCALIGSLSVNVVERKRHLADFFCDENKEGKIDFNIRITSIVPEDGLAFGYIFPIGKNGTTVDIAIRGNEIEIINDTLKPAPTEAEPNPISELESDLAIKDHFATFYKSKSEELERKLREAERIIDLFRDPTHPDLTKEVVAYQAKYTEAEKK